MGKNNKKLSDEQIAEIVRLYPDTENKVIAEHVGISIHTVATYRTRLGLKKTKEYISKISRENIMKHGGWWQLNTPESIKARSRTFREIHKKEAIRVRWGLEQKTRMAVNREPKGKIVQRSYLKQRGYIIDETTLTAYYTPGTRRCPRLEQIPRGETKGIIRPYYNFRPYDGRLD